MNVVNKFKFALWWVQLSFRMGFVLGDGLWNKIRLTSFLLSMKAYGFKKGKLAKFEILINRKKYSLALRRIAADAHLLSEMLVDEWYKSYLPSETPRVIFDIGANIGITPLYFKERYPYAQIFCFEPDPESYKILLENTRGLDNVRCFPVGIWNTEKKIKFFQSKHFHTRNSMLLNEAESKEIEVSVIPFGKALQEAGVKSVDFLKFDIEGAEIEMFEKMDHKIVRSFLGELHPGIRSEEVMENLVLSLRGGYDIELIKGGEKIWHIYGKHKTNS